MQTTSSQPRAIYYVVALQIWEYFSFYGMRALLILYLTNQLKYDDNHAYALFSAYCSLVYVTPILGGYLADKLLGAKQRLFASTTGATPARYPRLLIHGRWCFSALAAWQLRHSRFDQLPG